MRNKFLKKALVLVLSLTAVLSLGAVSLPAFAQSGEVTAISYNAYEAIVAGAPVALTADVTTGSGASAVTQKRPIRYTNFSVKEMNKLFNNFYAEGYVEGSDEVIKQNIVVVPDNIEYMINFGANTTDVEYIAPGEGALGLELDHTGANAADEPYYAAIKRLFPQIRNTTAVKQFGVNPDVADWGYYGDGQIAMKKTTAGKRNIFENIMFPKRGTIDVDTRISLPAGNYDTYIGTYSYWFARPVGIEFDGTSVASGYQVKPSKEVFADKNRAFTQGQHKIVVKGDSLYNEAMASFICITGADTAVYPRYGAPRAVDIIQLTETELAVSGLEAGAKLQIYNYDTSCLIKEYVVGAGVNEINAQFDPSELDGVSRIGLCQTNAGGMGETKIVQRTDISEMTVAFDSDFVGGDLEVTVSAKAASPIVRLSLKNGAGDELLGKTVAPAAEYLDKIYLKDNGSYVLELTSSVGGRSVKEFTVGNIDKVNPELALAFSLSSVKSSAKDKVALALSLSSVSTVSELGYVLGGEVTALSAQAKTVEFTKSGNYTVYMENVLGKSSAKKVRISVAERDIITFKPSVSPVNRYKSVALKGANGYKISAVTVYGTTAEGSEKMIVNGSGDDTKFNVYENGTYFIEVISADGTREIAVMNFGEDTKASSCGSFVLPAGWGAAAVGAAVLAALALLLLKKKKGEKNAD